MRVVIQRVTEAAVTVGEECCGKIGRGLCLLVGLTHDDVQNDLDYCVRKVLNLRLFEDPETGKPWTKSVQDLNLDVLSVSQFTLYANTHKGNKPDYHQAMKSEQSLEMYGRFLELLRSQYAPEKIQDGRFGAMMQVSIVNDGPVTIIIDSKSTKSS